MTLPHSKPPRHLHVFGISLLLIVGALVVFLFGVKMEAIAPATGVVTSPEILVLRATQSGLIEKTSARLEPSSETLLDGGLEIARIRPFGDPNSKSATAVLIPRESRYWLILEIHFEDGQRIQEGDKIATIFPVSSADGNVNYPVRLEMDEKDFGAVEASQEVRITSNMYPQRTHGVAKGVIDRIEPMGVESKSGSRKFYVWVKINESPYPLKLGSSVKAEVLVGRKRTYQIILEH